MRGQNDHSGQMVGCTETSQTEPCGLLPSPYASPDAPPLTLRGTPAHLLACHLACMQAKAPPELPPGTPPAVQKQLQRITCERGLTPVQINVLGIMLRWQHKVLSHAQVSAELFTTYGMKYPQQSVKEIVARLKRRQFINGSQTREGMIQGNKYTFFGDRLCDHIRSSCSVPAPGTHAQMPPGMLPESESRNTILKQLDRDNLTTSSKEKVAIGRLEALTENDIAFHWPNVAKQDFGTYQIRQIIERLSQVGASTQRVIEGLTRAEWELSHYGYLRDRKGNTVARLRGYIFDILAREGCYPRPEGYVSQEEQVVRDAEREAKAYSAALEARIAAEFEVWQVSLTSEELKRIVPPTNFDRGDHGRRALLRNHFREHVWPKRLTDSPSIQTIPSAHTVPPGADEGLLSLEPQKEARQRPETPPASLDEPKQSQGI